MSRNLKMALPLVSIALTTLCCIVAKDWSLHG